MTQEYNERSIQANLKTKTFGKDLQFQSTTDSTQNVALQAADEDAPEGFLVVADHQSMGRGRHEHAWESVAGKNLYLSLLFRPKKWPLARAQEIQFLAAVAAAQALEKTTNLKIDLKWPNDMWVKGKKLGGIILSTQTTSADDLHYIIMGMGLNLNADAKDFSKDVQKIATSVFMQTGEPLDRAKFLATLMQEMEVLYLQLQKKNFEFIRMKWQERALQANGKEVNLSDVITHPDSKQFPSLKGKAKGIDSFGHLLVETTDGKTVAVADGIVR